MEEGEPKTFKEAVRAAFYRQRAKVWAAKGVKQNPSPHKSFRPTPLYQQHEPPIYHYGRAITETLGLLWRHKRVFLGVLATAALASVILVGLMNQDKYQDVTNSLDDMSSELANGQLGTMARAGAIFLTTIATGGLNQSPTGEQQILNIFLMVLVWLATIWAMRQILLGRKLRVRDALYNAFGPLVPTLWTLIMGVIQALPIFLFVIIYSSAVETGFLGNPFYALLFWMFSAGLILLALHFLVPTVVSLVAVTAPGLYPLQALSNADDLMRGRKVQFMFHLFWGLVAGAVIWACVMIPMILIDYGLGVLLPFTGGWPIVPVTFLLLTLWSTMYLAAYVYLYYRRLIDEFKPKAD